jgi:CRP-like cAMP-binding protein
LTTPLLLRLNTYSKLSQADTQTLEALSRSPVHEVSPRRDVIREGENPRHVRLVLEGWACRYKSTRDGQRQIVGFFIPGDFCDFNVFVLRHMDHSIAAITRLRVAQIAPERVEEVTAEHPRIAQAFWWHELVNASIQREWLLNMGQRSAYERLGHLFVELFFRMRTAGLTERDSCEFPLTQSDLADATGLTSVHINRTLQDLRREGLVELERKQLRLPDLTGLINASGFNPNYLHLDHEGRYLDAND